MISRVNWRLAAFFYRVALTISFETKEKKLGVTSSVDLYPSQCQGQVQVETKCFNLVYIVRHVFLLINNSLMCVRRFTSDYIKFQNLGKKFVKIQDCCKGTKQQILYVSFLFRQ